MNASYIISQLQSNIRLFENFFKNIPDEMIHWKSQPEKWNLLEIVCHLYDEERDDFRSRLKHVLETPSLPMSPIDPQGWVVSRNYSSMDFRTMLNIFLDERKNSIEWLTGLIDPPLNNTYDHPKLGSVSGKLFLSNWLAHDYLHFRQITKIKYDYLSFVTGEKLDYAGNW